MEKSEKKYAMRSLLQVLTLFLVFVALTSSAVGARSTETVVVPLAAHVPKEWRKVGGKADPSQELDLIFALERKNVEELERIFWEVSDPDHENYGNHLTHSQVTNLISPGAEVIASVDAYLRGHGAKDIVVARHEDSIKCKATVAQVSAMLGVNFQMYENTHTKHRLARALGNMHLPAHIARAIEVVAGHNEFPSKPMQPIKRTDADIDPPAGMNVTPSVIYKTYKEDISNLPPVPAGQSNILSFFQASGQYVSQSDLTQFCDTLIPGLNGSDCKVAKYVNRDYQHDPGMESSLDSQYITATGHGLEMWVYTYGAPEFCKDLLSWAQDVFGEKDGKHPSVISMSYGEQSLNPGPCANSGGTGKQRTAEDIMKMGAMGITVVIASGDSGSAEYSRSTGWNYGYLTGSFPAEVPYATSVGSTTFENTKMNTERATTFSGGGFAWWFPMPKYQKDAVAHFMANNTQLPSDKYNASGRATPDVSFLGEQFYIVSDGVGYQVAGTSCSTPSFAGMVAQLNNIRLQNNKTLGFINPLLYKNPQGFTDITKGTNDMKGDGQGWYCKKGWDPVTGLGTPKFDQLKTIVNAINDKERQTQKSL